MFFNVESIMRIQKCIFQEAHGWRRGRSRDLLDSESLLPTRVRHVLLFAFLKVAGSTPPFLSPFFVFLFNFLVNR